MIISIIVAVAKDNVIGKDNSLIWHISEDLKRFKKITDGHTVIMGRKTYFSLPFRPLKNRRNIIISRGDKIDNVETVSSIQEALDLCKSEDEVFIIGGASIYEQTIDIADKIYLTKIDKIYEGDAFFPEIKQDKWRIVETSDMFFDEKAEIDFCYQILVKR